MDPPDPPEGTDRLSSRFSSLPPRWLFRAWVLVGGYRLTTAAPDDATRAYLWRTVPEGFLGKVAARDTIFEEAGRTGSLGDRPLVVLTAHRWEQATVLPDSTVEVFRKVRRRLHGELAGLSSNSDHRVVRGASHAIHRDDPDAVVAAIGAVVGAVREEIPVPKEMGDTLSGERQTQAVLPTDSLWRPGASARIHHPRPP